MTVLATLQWRSGQMERVRSCAGNREANGLGDGARGLPEKLPALGTTAATIGPARADVDGFDDRDFGERKRGAHELRDGEAMLVTQSEQRMRGWRRRYATAAVLIGGNGGVSARRGEREEERALEGS